KRGFALGHEKFRLDLPAHALHEVGRADAIKRYRNRATEQTAVEGDEPFGGVVAPEHDPVSFDDAARLELTGESERRGRELSVRRSNHLQTTLRNDGDALIVGAEVPQDVGQEAAWSDGAGRNGGPVGRSRLRRDRVKSM